MENASKALIMAAEILIGLMILSILIYGYTNIRGLSETQQGEKEAQQLSAFNKQYESYNKKLLRGTDVISLINKAIDNNEKYENEEYYKITIKLKLEDDLAAYYRNNKGEVVKTEKDSLKKGTLYSFSSKNDAEYETLFTEKDKTDELTFKDFKRRIFNCTNIHYNKTSGRVDEMEFHERKQNDLRQGIIE